MCGLRHHRGGPPRPCRVGPCGYTVSGLAAATHRVRGNVGSGAGAAAQVISAA